MSRSVYLDYNATAPVRPEAASAVAAALAVAGNPSSVHAPGRAARRLLEEAREAVAALVCGRSQEVIFTSGGTEANNLALSAGDRRLLVSAGEHDSVLRAAPGATRLALRPDGVVDLAALRELLAAEGRPALVSVMQANNETGVIQPMAEIVALAREAGALVHCDAVQSAGKIALDMSALDLDLVSLSAHKLGGPQGVGALVLGPGRSIEPALKGGGQERGRRAGTENLPGAAGFGAAAAAALDALPMMAALAPIRDRLESEVLALSPGSRIFGREAPRLPNTSCFSTPGLSAETQVMALDLAGVAVSAGSACSSGKVQPSHVLGAMGAGPDEARSAIRVSLGWQTQEADIRHFLAAWRRLYEKSRATSPTAA